MVLHNMYNISLQLPWSGVHMSEAHITLCVSFAFLVRFVSKNAKKNARKMKLARVFTLFIV